jgi:hypothetical protein
MKSDKNVTQLRTLRRQTPHGQGAGDTYVNSPVGGATS